MYSWRVTLVLLLYLFFQSQYSSLHKKGIPLTHLNYYDLFHPLTIVGRVVGGGFRVGNSCTPVVDSCQCMAKPIQYCKEKENYTQLNTEEHPLHSL